MWGKIKTKYYQFSSGRFRMTLKKLVKTYMRHKTYMRQRVLCLFKFEWRTSKYNNGGYEIMKSRFCGSESRVLIHRMQGCMLGDRFTDPLLLPTQYTSCQVVLNQSPTLILWSSKRKPRISLCTGMWHWSIYNFIVCLILFSGTTKT